MVNDLAEHDAVLDLQVQGFTFSVDGQQVLKIGIMSQIAVDPIGEGQLLLHAHRVRGAFCRLTGHAPERLQVLLFGHDSLELTADILGFKVHAESFEFIVSEATLVLRLLLVAELVDHLTDLVAGQLEAHLVQGLAQFLEFDKAILVFVDLGKGGE